MKTKKTIITIVLTALISASVGAIIVYSILNTKKETIDEGVPVQKIEYVFCPAEVAITGEEIQAGIREISELNTAEYYFTRVQNLGGPRKCSWLEIFGIEEFEIPLTDNSLIYSYDGEIKAGIDYSKVLVEKNDTEKKIAIRCPKASITSSSVNPDSFQLYEEKNNILNPIDPSIMSKGNEELLAEEEKEAISGGLLKRAEEGAKTYIENFVKSLCDKDYVVEVTFDL